MIVSSSNVNDPSTQTAGPRLEYLRRAGVAPDERVSEAIELIISKGDGDGRGPLEVRYPGTMPVEIDEGEGRPSRWNTLRALRVLRWYSVGNETRLPYEGISRISIPSVGKRPSKE